MAEAGREARDGKSTEPAKVHISHEEEVRLLQTQVAELTTQVLTLTAENRRLNEELVQVRAQVARSTVPPLVESAAFPLPDKAPDPQLLAPEKRTLNFPPTMSIPERIRALPEEAPPEARWANRDKAKKQTPEEFLKETLFWVEIKEVGLLYQDVVGKLEPKLLKAIKGWCGRTEQITAEILPPKKARTDLMLSKLDQCPVDEQETERLLWAKKKRKTTG